MQVRFLLRTHLEMLLSDTEELDDLWLVEADDNLVINDDDWHAHLTTFCDHFLSLLLIRCYIDIDELHILLLKEVLCHVAEVAARCTVYSDCVHNHKALRPVNLIIGLLLYHSCK
jgi:hypothetical protein